LRAFKGRLSASPAPPSSEHAGSANNEAHSAAIDALQREIDDVRGRAAYADREAASARMAALVQMSQTRAALAVASVIPSSHRKLLQLCVNFQYEHDLQVRTLL
jgi:hypothetical protein